MGEKKVKINKEMFEKKGNLFNFSFFCFDYFYEIKKGKLKGKKILIKRVKDSNTITKKSYEYLITFSALTDTYPLILADNYNIKNKLKDEHVYFFKSIPMMNENTFLKLLEKGKVEYFHNYKSYLLIDKEEKGIRLFEKELKEIIEEEFKKIKKEIESNIIEIKKLVDYYFKNKDAFIKETTKFDLSKEKKIIEFSKINEKDIVFISKFHSKPIFKEDFLVLPKKDIKNIKDITKFFEEFQP